MRNRISNILKGAWAYIGGLIALLVVVLIINVGLLSIQTVDFYEIKPAEGKKIVLGFDRGSSWLTNGWDMEIDDNLSIIIRKSGEVYAKGTFHLEKTDEINAWLNSTEVTLVSLLKQHKLDGAVYCYEDKIVHGEYGDGMALVSITTEYCYFAVFEKNNNVSVFLKLEKDLDEEEITQLFSKLTGTRGLGYWVAYVISEAFSDD